MRHVRQLVVFGMLCGASAGATPDAARRFKAEGDGLVQRGKTDEAIAAFQSAIREDSEWLVAYDALAASLFAAGRFDEVVKHLRPVVDKHANDYATGWYSLGYAYRKSGKLAESVDAYQHYLKLRPDDAEAYYGLGKAQLGLDKKDDAVASFGKYIALEKRPSEQRWVEKARSEVQALRDKGAKAVATKDEAGSPGERTATAKAAQLADQADAEAKKGHLEVAYGLYGRARGLDPSSVRIYDGLGETGTRVKKHKELVALFRNALADNPGYASGFYYLGLVLSESGKKPEALEAMKRFCALEPTSPDGQWQLARLYRDSGRTADAKKAYQKFLAVENRPGADHDANKKEAAAFGE